MPPSLKEQTQQGLQQIQQNVRTLKKWDNKLNNWDEVSQSIDKRIQQQFDNIPAEFGTQSSSPDFEEPLSKKLHQSHQQPVSETSAFETEVIKTVNKNEAQNNNWLKSFKQALSSDSIQNQLQKFKDKVSQQTVKVGNRIASLPDEIATQALMKSLAQKFESGQSLLPQTDHQSGYQLGDYQLVRSGFQRLSLLDKHGQE